MVAIELVHTSYVLCPRSSLLFLFWVYVGLSRSREGNHDGNHTINFACNNIMLQCEAIYSDFLLGYFCTAATIVSNGRVAAQSFIRTSYLGIFALLPLLFRTEELLLKVALCITWLSGTIFTLELAVPKTKCNENLLTLFDYVAFFVMACLLLFMEVIHPIVFLPSGRLEFLPLMATSVACGVGLLYCWMESSVIMIVTATKR